MQAIRRNSNSDIMAILKKSYNDYDKETKGIWQKIKLPLLIALAIILFIIVLSLGLTDAGFFPGNVIHRFAVSSFLEDTYADLGYELIEYDGYDPKTDYFVYNCRVNGLECEMKAKNFSVQYDGYYHKYCRNTYFQDVTSDYMSNYLTSKWNEKHPEYSVNWKSEIDIPLSNTKYPNKAPTAQAIDESLILDACKTYGGSFEFTVDVYGESISFDEYKATVYKIVRILQTEMDNRPLSLQVFYYRSDNSGENVMQYESYLWTHQFDYTEQGVLSAENVHKYVEVPEDIQRKANIYYTVRKIVIIVVSVTIVALSALWIFRRYRKYKKNKNYKNSI